MVIAQNKLEIVKLQQKTNFSVGDFFAIKNNPLTKSNGK